MRRRLFSLAAGVSLLLCMATVMLWVYTARREVVSVGNCFSEQLRLYASTGTLRIERWKFLFPEADARWGQRVSFEVRSDRSYPHVSLWHMLRGEWSAGPLLFGNTEFLARGGYIAFPLWFLAAAFLILPLRVALRVVHPRPESGCQHCDYDLTGNTSGVCPECGTPVTGKSA